MPKGTGAKVPKARKIRGGGGRQENKVLNLPFLRREIIRYCH